ncbi:hypothetical protein FPOA_03371 [Fusarium poae]|uniref:Uncharacterized protein n=1 Tax=Fusarium poae TaxID=36050 RepID=A0A1B8B9N1_FUSPO|nr:hypothetical protein FPOA_03371 [Fusarium poae]
MPSNNQPREGFRYEIRRRLNHLRQRSNRSSPEIPEEASAITARPMILYHYCQNDETGHALYIFSALILSLLQQCEGLKRTFFDWYNQDLLTGNFEPSTNVHKLVGFFQRTVQGLDRPFFLNTAATALESLGAARRRVSILELSRAIALGTAGPDITTVAEVAERVDDQCVMALIQPFIAGVDVSNRKKRQIVIVHQSAKEFILYDLALTRPGFQNVATGLTAGGTIVNRDITSRLENNIFKTCVRYLLLDEINRTPLFSDEQIAILELPEWPNGALILGGN